MPVPSPTPIVRLMHLDNLPILLQRGELHAPNFAPDDGLIYHPIHNPEIQRRRQLRVIPCGPGGVIHDYVPFYFGPRPPMLLQLHTGQVQGYNEGQMPLIYLVSTVQIAQESGVKFVFSDGHGIAAYTSWYDDLAHLDQVDWEVVRARHWKDTPDDMDRQRRKQAEFLVHRFYSWSLVQGIVVLNSQARDRVETIQGKFAQELHRSVSIQSAWYY